MELKGEKWKNYSTPYIDKYGKDELLVEYVYEKDLNNEENIQK